MLLMAKVPLEYYYVHGLESSHLPFTMLNGYIPDLSAPMLRAALLCGGVLLCAVVMLQMRLRVHRLRPWKRAFVVFLLVANFFCAWEISLQMFARQLDEPLFIPDPVLFWNVNPELQQEWVADQRHLVAFGNETKSMNPQIDDLLTNPVPTPSPSSQTYRILCLGDSQAIAIDPGFDIPHAYPKLLKGLLEKRFPKARFEVINAGVPGFSSWQGLLLARRLVDLRPDLLIFCFGHHDGTPSLGKDSDVITDDRRVHAMRSLMYRSQLCLLIRTLAIKTHERSEERKIAGHEEAPTCRVPLDEYERNLEAVAALGSARGIRVAFMVEPQSQRSFQADEKPRVSKTKAATASRREDGAPLNAERNRHADAMRRVSAKTGALLLDVRGELDKQTDDDEHACFDSPVHLTRRGHQRVAELLDKMLAPVLSKRLSP
ncbi:MAG: SGNH/GDSL hydrolase family protein [Proteobacteria bacterium]|nr:SGNH/GDSL hydrolase family protein [Pseudomonadota bacterium]